LDNVARVPDTATKPSLAADLEKHLKEWTRAGWGGGGWDGRVSECLMGQKTVKSIMLLSEQIFITKHVPFHAETGLLPLEVVSIARVL